MQITTCQLNQIGEMRAKGWIVFDITVALATRKDTTDNVGEQLQRKVAQAFAPTWDMVKTWNKSTKDELSKKIYLDQYYPMMRKSYSTNERIWLDLLIGYPKLCFACFCKTGEFCHRTALVGMLKKVADSRGIECEIIPEGETAEEDADGITHINLYSKGKTELGRDMSNFAHMPLEIEGREFASLEAYWYWLGLHLEDDDPDKVRLQGTFGFSAKKLGRELQAHYGKRNVDDFESKIKSAMWLKVTMYPRLEKALRESTLPFRHYYVANGNRIDAGFEWIVQEWEKIRRELKTPMTPDPEPTHRGTTPKNITSLKKGEVFVFGSNGQGFHGAGSAGMAFRGESSNTWREDKAFLAAMNAPKGSPERVGKWAIFGVAWGYMEGKEGASYAIQTVVKPGAKKSIPLDEILTQLRELATFAAEHPEMAFLCTITGGGYNGYSVEEMREVYTQWEQFDVPMNITFPEEMMPKTAPKPSTTTVEVKKESIRVVKYYAGIGSRKAPEEALNEATKIGHLMAEKNWVLRSGGAKGMDSAFEAGADVSKGAGKEIFRPKDVLPWAYEELKRCLPSYLDENGLAHLKPYVRDLLARDMQQILGKNGDRPVEFVVCWTPAGADDGGTGYAIRCAKRHGIPVYNLKNEDEKKAFYEKYMK